MVDAGGIPLAVTLTSGNRNDITQLIPLVDAVPRRTLCRSCSGIGLVRILIRTADPEGTVRYQTTCPACTGRGNHRG
jgi:hypothetical protein